MLGTDHDHRPLPTVPALHLDDRAGSQVGLEDQVVLAIAAPTLAGGIRAEPEAQLALLLGRQHLTQLRARVADYLDDLTF